MRLFIVAVAASALFSNAQAETLSQPMQIEICKATISVVMGRSTDAMRGTVTGGFPTVEYTRDDGKRWKYSCKIDPSTKRSVWRGHDGASWGRWRNGPYDSPVSYEANGGKLHIRETHVDSSVSSETFALPAKLR